VTPKRVFITGASGCIGHYLTEALIQNTQHELFILVRNPSKLRFDCCARPGVTVIQGDLRQIEQHNDLLATIDVAVLTATAWGGAEESYDVNVRKTLALIQALDPDRVEQILYFSTESILDADNQLLPEAYELGSDYIRTKYLCFKELGGLALSPKITVLCPSLVFGGDENKPFSHLTSGIPEVMRWLWLIRFFDVDASFHHVHAYDIGQVVQQLVNEPPTDTIAPGNLRKMILGNQSTTANAALDEACQYFNQRRVFTVPIRVWLAEFLIRIFRIQVGPWDRFCIRYRHFVHQNPVNPATFGLPIYGATFSDLLKLSGMMPKKR
jgi:nucleoside-diphosphate-sugar epimerase